MRGNKVKRWKSKKERMSKVRKIKKEEKKSKIIMVKRNM